MPGNPNTHRSFIALSLPDHVKQELCRQQRVFRKSRMVSGSFPKPVGFHLTLFFLGDCTDTQLDQATTCLHHAVEGKKCFDLEIGELGTFPGPGRPPRVLWAGLKGDVGSLKRLWKDLNLELRKKNRVIQKQGFSPHITLARFKKTPPGKEFEDLKSQVRKQSKPVRFRIEKLELFTSRLTSSGAIHTPVQEARFC